MAVTCKAENRALYAAIDGEVDHHRARQILGELVRQIDLTMPRHLTVDLGASALWIVRGSPYCCGPAAG